MSQLTSERLMELTILALERTAFVMADPAESSAEDAVAATSHVAKINYAGPEGGSVVLCASDGFLREFASSLLGVEPEEVNPKCEGADALKELANIVGGSVILELGGDNCPYSLGLPSLVETSVIPPIDHGSNQQIACVIEAELEPLCIIWQKDAVAQAA
ncbi:MAG: chemotaxis protein CheX [Phycisphaerales bacterium]|nr:MAG: chemotaxis protein CheX [Phycisphaerales bacterium]